MDEAWLRVGVGGGREGGREGYGALALEAGRGKAGHHGVLKGEDLGRGGLDAVLELEQVFLLCGGGVEGGGREGTRDVEIAVVVALLRLGWVVVVVYAEAPDLLGDGHGGCYVHGGLEGLWEEGGREGGGRGVRRSTTRGLRGNEWGLTGLLTLRLCSS